MLNRKLLGALLLAASSTALTVPAISVAADTSADRAATQEHGQSYGRTAEDDRAAANP
jgi:hypothetical protein